MSVLGVGTDIVDIRRIDAMKGNVLAKLAQRVLTPNELILYEQHANPIAYLAKRWAGKEALSKALGTGIAQGVSFQHIEIKSSDTGQPRLLLTEQALTCAQKLGANNWHISLSDERHYAVAFVVLSV